MARPKTRCVAVELFPQLSVARQILVAVKPVAQVPLVTVLMMVGLTTPFAKSMAVGSSNVHGRRQFTFLSAAGVMEGGAVSRTVTVCEQLVLLPHASAS